MTIDTTKLRELAPSENQRIFESWFKKNFQHMGAFNIALALKKNDEGRYSDPETSLMFSAFAYGKLLSERDANADKIAKAIYEGMESNMARLRKIESAAQNLAKVRGRHNSEIAMNKLLETLK